MARPPNGFYRMFRGWMDNPVFQGETFTKAMAWEWMIGEANFRDRHEDIKGRTVVVKRGQLSKSTRFLAKAWGWSEAKVRRFLTRLKTDAMIDAVTDAGQTLITICNYSRYQAEPKDSDAESDALNDAGATQERRKLEEGKKERKEYTVDFDAFVEAYPSRKPHSDPPKPARAKFVSAVKAGALPREIICGAKNYAAHVEHENTDPKFIAQMTTFLNQERWKQYQEPHIGNGSTESFTPEVEAMRRERLKEKLSK